MNKGEMDRGIWATWYDLPEEGKEEYIAWLHDVHLPKALLRPGYLWAAHIENIWDHASGALLVTEAGGRVTDIMGKPFDFTKGKKLAHNCGAVATNGRVHDAVLEALRAQRSCCRLK